MTTILHLIDTSGPGGAETVFKNLFERFDGEGYRSLALVTAGSWVQGALLESGAEVHESDSKGSFNLPYLRHIVGLVRQAGVDLIQAHFFGAGVYASLAGLITRTPVVTILHGSVDVPQNDRMLRLKAAAINMGTDRLVTVSGRLKNELLARTSLSAKRMCVIHNGVDTTRLKPGRSDKLRGELGLADDALVVCALGNIRRAKGYPHLIEAAALVGAVAPHVHFVVAGEGERRGQLMSALLEQADALGVASRVHFLGYRDDTLEVLRGSDLFVLPSTSEGFSISTVEAMACGLPVVATRSGGPEEIITPDVDGILIPPADPAALARSVLGLVADPGRRASLAEAAVATASRRFSLSTQLAAYEALYGGLLD